MFGPSQSVEDILEGLRQPEWRIPLDMLQSKTLAAELTRLRSENEALRAERDKLKVDRDFIQGAYEGAGIEAKFWKDDRANLFEKLKQAEADLAEAVKSCQYIRDRFKAIDEKTPFRETEPMWWIEFSCADGAAAKIVAKHRGNADG